MKKHIQIKNSYDVWLPTTMKTLIYGKYSREYGDYSSSLKIKHLAYLVIEWWLHNVGYYLTLPLIKNPKIKALNERFKHVDLMVEREDTE